MKTTLRILLATLFVSVAHASDSVSIEQFRKMGLSEQEKAIREASAEMKPVLQKVYMHDGTVRYLGGEDAYRREKEDRLIERRGMAFVISLFSSEVNLFGQRESAIITANQKLGMKSEEQLHIRKVLDDREKVLLTRCKMVRQLVLKVVPSSESAALGAAAKKREIEIRNSHFFTDGRPVQPMTEDEFAAFGKELDQLVEQIKALPMLTDEQVQKEYDEFPDEKIVTKLH